MESFGTCGRWFGRAGSGAARWRHGCPRRHCPGAGELDDRDRFDRVPTGKSADFYDRIRRVAGAYERARQRRAKGDPHVQFPTVPEIVVAAHQVSLELTPLEYLATPADFYFELTMNDVWVWDVYRSDRFVKSVRVLTFKDVNVEVRGDKDLELPKELALDE